jgi:ribonuclease HI
MLEIVAKLENMLNELTQWGSRCGLKFNEEKTVVINFSRTRKCSNLRIRMNNKELLYDDKVRYLGVIVHRNLDWRPHLREKIAGAKRLLMKIMCLAMDSYRPKPELMRWAYKGIVLPQLLYGSMVWGHECYKLEGQLRRLNRMGMNLIAQIPRSTPSRALELIYDVLPLTLAIKQAGALSYLRLRRDINIDWDGKFLGCKDRVSHLKYWEDLIVELDLPREIDEDLGGNEEILYNVNRASLSGEKKYLTQSQYTAYTDGSKGEKGTGAGFIIYKEGKREKFEEMVKLPDYASVFQAEVVAIQSAAKCLIEQSQKSQVKYVKIISDSQAAMLALAKKDSRQKCVQETISTLNELKKKMQIPDYSMDKGTCRYRR